MIRLSSATQLLYTELLQQCAIALPSRRGVSFSTKTVKQNKYWYMEVVVGSGKKQYSLGRDTDDLRALIENQKALYQRSEPGEKQRQRLVAMLNSGGLVAPRASTGRVVELLAQSGVFLSGGTLVGSTAFSAYQGMLGIEWPVDITQTEDMDEASARSINVAIKEDAPDVRSVLLESELGFFEVPALSHKSPSTRFSIRGQAYVVDLVTPLHGPDSSDPVRLAHFNSYAHPLRFLDYLLEDVQIAVIPFRSGVLVNVPTPARFALHKLVVSQRRPPSQQTKANKDILQAEKVIEVLLEDRPGDLWLAFDAAQKQMPRKFMIQLEQGQRKLNERVGRQLIRSQQKG